MKKLVYAQRVLSGVMTLFCGILLPVLLFAQPAAEKRRVHVEIQTELGTVVVELFNQTPIHRDNFIQLVKQGAYDSLLFHRIIPGFMVQGGDPSTRNAAKDTVPAEGNAEETLPAEIVPGLFHKRGALAAAREGDDVNPEKRSSPTQFYIVQGRQYQPDDLARLEERSARYGEQHTFTEAEKHVYSTLGGAPHLDGSYTVFGQVVQGMEVIDAIAMLPADNDDRPLADIRMFMRLK